MADYFDHAAPGDIIKSHSGFAYFSQDKKWVGSLTALRPGEGYLFRRMAQGPVEVNFYNLSNSVSGLTAKRSNSPKVNPTGDAALFTNANAASNMTMIATLNTETIPTGQTRILVYIGDELVGVASPLSIEGKAGEELFYFITVQSDKTGTLRFETEDGMALQAINHQSPITDHQPVIYTPNDHVGSLKAPVLLTPGENDRVYKMMENNHIIIIRNNEKYDVTGKKL